ncbi:unnamed protein product [Diatraea saccharalis]|uniref:Uncharacterized protein n=1 Tax=Diatraea saccharalis TaxID=40085 RepID=A0A9N9R4S6_9NEOP|nr:unnamed protein product [Diatraea saccharalis]
MQIPTNNIKNNEVIDLHMGDDSSGTDSDSSDDSDSHELDIKENFNNADNKDGDNIETLRKALRSCNRSAYRRCKKACKSAYRITCSEYYCARKIKKAFNRRCSTNCRMNFS